MISLKNKHFLKLLDFTPAEISYLIDLAADLKAKKKAGIPHRLCEGKNIALIFEKTSTRTRCAFEVAAADLGMHPVYLDPSGSQIGKKESIADTARVLGFGDHGSTFGGNPVACAGAVSIMERLDEAFLADVKKKSDYVFAACKGAKGIKSVSGLGLMIGIETERPAAEIVKKCMERGVLCLTAKSKVRLLPALNIPMELLAEAVEIIKTACAEEE